MIRDLWARDQPFVYFDPEETVSPTEIKPGVEILYGQTWLKVASVTITNMIDSIHTVEAVLQDGRIAVYTSNSFVRLRTPSA
jgi:hypothetical protein